MKFGEYITEANMSWKKGGPSRYYHEHDKTRSIIVRRLPDGWEIRFMKELSPGEPPAPMVIKRGFKSDKEAIKVANQMMKDDGNWEYHHGKVDENMSGKAYHTLQNMVAIVRRPEEIENTMEIINKAEKEKMILPVQAQRLRRELDSIRSSL
jgi:hypothetical protein